MKLLIFGILRVFCEESIEVKRSSIKKQFNRGLRGIVVAAQRSFTQLKNSLVLSTVFANCQIKEKLFNRQIRCIQRVRRPLKIVCENNLTSVSPSNIKNFLWRRHNLCDLWYFSILAAAYGSHQQQFDWTVVRTFSRAVYSNDVGAEVSAQKIKRGNDDNRLHSRNNKSSS